MFEISDVILNRFNAITLHKRLYREKNYQRVFVVASDEYKKIFQHEKWQKSIQVGRSENRRVAKNSIKWWREPPSRWKKPRKIFNFKLPRYKRINFDEMVYFFFLSTRLCSCTGSVAHDGAWSVEDFSFHVWAMLKLRAFYSAKKELYRWPEFMRSLFTLKLAIKGRVQWDTVQLWNTLYSYTSR